MIALQQIIINLTQPAYNYLISLLTTTMIDNFNLVQTIIIGAFILIMAIISVCYFFVWIPFENNLNLTIYKTKKMLSILPKEVLAKISNIQKLLEIETSNKKKTNSHDNIVKHNY